MSAFLITAFRCSVMMLGMVGFWHAKGGEMKMNVVEEPLFDDKAKKL